MRDYEEFMREQNTESYVHEYKPNPPNPLSLSLSQGILRCWTDQIIAYINHVITQYTL